MSETFTSRSKSESFITPMIFEYALTIILTLVATGLISSYIIGRFDLRHSRNSNEDSMITQNFFSIIATISIAATIASVIAVYRLRNTWQIVEFTFDDVAKQVRITRRKISVRSLEEMVIPYSRFHLKKSGTKGFLFVAKYQGYEVYDGTNKIGWLLGDHFTWEEQGMAYRAIVSTAAEINA